MTDRLIECVPNFSEGRDMAVIKQITDEVEAVEGVKLLDVDPGMAVCARLRTKPRWLGEGARFFKTFENNWNVPLAPITFLGNVPRPTPWCGMVHARVAMLNS